MQRDISEFLRSNVERLLDHQIAFGRIRLNQHLGGNFIDLLVAVTAEIGLAAVDFRIVAAAHDVVKNVMRVGRAGRPAEQVKRSLITAGLQHFGEILRNRQGGDLLSDGAAPTLPVLTTTVTDANEGRTKVKKAKGKK